MLRERELRMLWLPMTNRAALEELRRGRVHAAVVHGTAIKGGETTSVSSLRRRKKAGCSRAAIRCACAALPILRARACVW